MKMFGVKIERMEMKSVVWCVRSTDFLLRGNPVKTEPATTTTSTTLNADEIFQTQKIINQIEF